jgi:hypothetical protein
VKHSFLAESLRRLQVDSGKQFREIILEEYSARSATGSSSAVASGDKLATLAGASAEPPHGLVLKIVSTFYVVEPA